MSPFRRILSMCVAVLSVGTVTVLLIQYPWLFDRGAFALLLGCVFLSTFIGDWRSGILALLCGLGVSAWFMKPADSLRIESDQDVVRLGILIVVGSMIAFLHASRSRAVERATLSESRLGTALNAARMAAWEKNLCTGEFWFSPGLAQIFGRSPGSFHQSYDEFLSYIHPDDRDFVQNAFTKSLENGMEFEVEHRIIRPDKSERWIVTRGQIVFDATGHRERLLAIAADVTDRHLAAQAVPAPRSRTLDNPVIAQPGRL